MFDHVCTFEHLWPKDATRIGRGVCERRLKRFQALLGAGKEMRFISCSFVGMQGQAQKILILTILPILRNSFSLRMLEDEDVDRQRRARGRPHAGRELTDKLCIECMVYTYSVHTCSLPFVAFQLGSDEPS